MNHGVSRREALFGTKHIIFQEFELVSNRTSHDLRGNGLAKPDFRLGSWLALAGRARQGELSGRAARSEPRLLN